VLGLAVALLFQLPALALVHISFLSIFTAMPHTSFTANAAWVPIEPDASKTPAAPTQPIDPATFPIQVVRTGLLLAIPIDALAVDVKTVTS
jgi:hypothetical protein